MEEFLVTSSIMNLVPYSSRGVVPTYRWATDWPVQQRMGGYGLGGYGLGGLGMGGLGMGGLDDWMRMPLMERPFERDVVNNPFFGADIYETDKSVNIHCDLPGM